MNLEPNQRMPRGVICSRVASLVRSLARSLAQMPCHALRARIRFCLGDYDQLMHLALLLIYVQIGCSLVGSLGALFNGVSLINLVIALFALVAIESSSQSLGRAYALLLCCGILLDIFWFILFSRQIWNTSSSHDHNPLFVFSLRLLFCMQIAGFSVRTASSFLWIQMYRLGLSNVQNTTSRPSDLRYSFLNPPTPTALPRQNSHSDEILGGSIYDPTYYSSLFEGPQDNKLVRQKKIHKGKLKYTRNIDPTLQSSQVMKRIIWGITIASVM
ncbi:hypothetical protein Scep_003071 [Stephania cephalantha]|uniref:Transmembrane protein n=1 Tax=Stephania cephalantha TaxID=152367 RepID=A0AAP0KRU8_9MAGN